MLFKCKTCMFYINNECNSDRKILWEFCKKKKYTGKPCKFWNLSRDIKPLDMIAVRVNMEREEKE